MMQLEKLVKRTDVTFTIPRDPGDPGCLCSRCLLPIAASNLLISLEVSRNGRGMLRYHQDCLEEQRSGNSNEPLN
jgi:hypothetical protein